MFSLKQLVLTAIFVSHGLLTVETANILFFIGFGSPSHHLALQPLANGLAEKGHSVTFLLQEAPKPGGSNSTIKYFIPTVMANHFISMRNNPNGGGINFYDMRKSGRGRLMSVVVQFFGIKVCEKLYEDPAAIDWIKSNKFDLVVIDGLFNECAYGIAHEHGAKTIVFSISTVLPWAIESMGTPDESAWVPDPMFSVPLEMNFAHRTWGAIGPLLYRLFRHWYYLPKMGEITAEGLKKNVPNFEELERNTSLVFVNSHPSQELPRALPPNFIQVGGISWVNKRKALPEVV